MPKPSFKFLDHNRNQRLIALVKHAGIDHHVDAKGAICYSQNVEDEMDHLIGQARSEKYRHWQVVTCPRESASMYKKYMTQHRISFEEELIDGEPAFLISRNRRPHSWKLEESAVNTHQVA